MLIKILSLKEVVGEGEKILANQQFKIGIQLKLRLYFKAPHKITSLKVLYLL